MIESSSTREVRKMKMEATGYRRWLERNRRLAWVCGLALMLLVALTIRLTAIGWGLPNQAYYYSLFVPDETSELIATLLLGERAYQYPVIRLQPFFYFLSFIYFSLYFLFALATGRVTSWAEYLAWQQRDLAHFILVGRVFMVLLGVLTVFLTFVVARRLFGKRAGFVSAAVLLLSLGHVTYSRIFRLDSLMPFVTVLAFYLLLRMIYDQDQKLRWYVLAGFVVAAATATKLSGFALLGPLLLIPFLDPDRDWMLPVRKPVFSRQYVFALFVCLASYIMIAGPSQVIRLQITFGGDISQAPRSIIGMASRFGQRESFSKLGGLSTFDASLPYHLTSSLPRLLGITSYLFALLGSGFMIFERRNRAGVLLLLFTVLAFLLPIGRLQRAADRDVLPILPLLAVCAGYGIDRLLGLVRQALERDSRMKWARLGVILVLLAVIAIPAINVARHTYLLTQEDTRNIAASWIEANIPAGTAIVTEPYGPGILGGASRTSSPGGRPAYHIYDLLEGTTDGIDQFDPESLRPFLEQTGAEYVVLSSGYYHRFYNAAMEHHFPEHAEQGQVFHNYLANELQLVKTIAPDWRSTPGPVIRIFRVGDLASGRAPEGGIRFDPYPGFDRDFRAIGYDASELKWPWIRVENWSGAAAGAGESSR
jgi:hypothetical protein